MVHTVNVILNLHKYLLNFIFPLKNWYILFYGNCVQRCIPSKLSSISNCCDINFMLDIALFSFFYVWFFFFLLKYNFSTLFKNLELIMMFLMSWFQKLLKYIKILNNTIIAQITHFTVLIKFILVEYYLRSKFVHFSVYLNVNKTIIHHNDNLSKFLLILPLRL